MRKKKKEVLFGKFHSWDNLSTVIYFQNISVLFSVRIILDTVERYKMSFLKIEKKKKKIEKTILLPSQMINAQCRDSKFI